MKAKSDCGHSAGNAKAPKSALPSGKNHPHEHKLQHADYAGMTGTVNEKFKGKK